MKKTAEVAVNAQGWIHELARAEVHPDAERLLNLGRAFDPQQLVEESTIEFLSSMRDCLQDYAKVFNAYSESGQRFQDIKVYNLAHTAADFMVYRNQIKLMVANVSHGVIQVSFSQHLRSPTSINGNTGSAEATARGGDALGQPQELQAQVGAFRDVKWTFQGEKVEPEHVARFYFSEFCRVTRDPKRAKATNQALLDQIRSLLQERGLDL